MKEQKMREDCIQWGRRQRPRTEDGAYARKGPARLEAQRERWFVFARHVILFQEPRRRGRNVTKGERRKKPGGVISK